MKNTYKYPIILSIIILSYLSVSIFIIDYRGHNKWGDNWTTMLTMYSGKEFAEKGFINLQFTPRIPKGPGIIGETLYTHFPPLPYYLGGLLWRLGFTSIAFTKFIYALLASLAIAGFFSLVSFYFGNKLGIIAACLLIFHLISYTQLSSTPMVMGDALSIWGVYFLSLALYRTGRTKHYLLLVSSIILFLGSWCTFENIVWVQIIASYLIYIRYKNIKTVILGSFLIGLIPVLMFVLHFAANAWAFGSIEKAYDDFVQAFIWRTQDAGRNTDYFLSIAGGPSNFPFWLVRQVVNLYGLLPFYNQIIDVPLRQTYYTTSISISHFILLLPLFSGIVIFLITYIYNVKYRDILRKYLTFLFFLLLADISFWLIFQQLATIHLYRQIGRHLLTSYALYISGSIYFALLLLNRNEKVVASKVTALCLLFLVSIIPLYNLLRLVHDASSLKNTGYKNEILILQEIGKHINTDDIVITNDNNLSSNAFIHQPKESFNLNVYDIELIKNENALKDRIIEDSNKGIETYLWLENKRFAIFLAENTIKPGRHKLLLTNNKYSLYKVLSNRSAEVSNTINSYAPLNTVVSRDETESLDIGPYTGAYSSTISIVKNGMMNMNACNGKYYMKIESMNSIKSGLQTKSSKIPSIDKGEYLISFCILVRNNKNSLRFAIASDSKIDWARDFMTEKSYFNISSNAWQRVIGLINIPQNRSNSYIFIVNENYNTSNQWLIDDIIFEKISY